VRCPPLCAHALAPNRDHHPGSRLTRSSRGRAAAVGPEHGAGHSFLWPSPAAALGPRWPVASPSPPVKTSRHHPAAITTWPAPWQYRTIKGEGGATLGATVAPGPHQSQRHGAQPTGPAPLLPPARSSPAPPPAARTSPLSRTPLPASGGKPGDGTPTPPVSICPVRKFFQKIIPGKITPPGDGTQPKNFHIKNSSGT
jgi:hypothetical protein